MSLRTQPTTLSDNDFPATDVMAPHPVDVASVDGASLGDSGTSENDVVRRDVMIPKRPVGLMGGAVLALLLSAWAALVPFVGPTFGFSADGTSSWTWDRVHFLGAVVPGAVGVLACLLILASARRSSGFWSSAALRTWGFAIFLCGAWLSAVPAVWPVVVGRYFHAASPSMNLAHWMAYASGPGVLLAAFGAYVIGRASSQRALTKIDVA